MKKIIFLLILATSAFTTFAQEKAGKKDTIQHTTFYYCGMHPDVVSDEPGKCPECGMELLLSKKEQMKAEVTKTYHCPAHLDVTSSKPGKCSKCGKSLTLSKKEEMKMKVMKIYACPTHPNVTSNKPGKCAKCGMKLEEKKSKSKS